MSESILRVERLDQLLAVLVGADDDGAAVEPALARPAAHQRAQHQALGDQRGQTDEEERRQPQPRNFAAELGEERHADEQQEHERPGRDHPRHLAQLAAKHLDLIDVGGLEADHRGDGHADDRRDVFPAEAGERHHIPEIKRDADQAQQDEIDHADRAGDHDRRIGAVHFLVGDGKRGRRQPPAPFDRAARRCCAARRGI